MLGIHLSLVIVYYSQCSLAHHFLPLLFCSRYRDLTTPLDVAENNVLRGRKEAKNQMVTSEIRE